MIILTKNTRRIRLSEQSFWDLFSCIVLENFDHLCPDFIPESPGSELLRRREMQTRVDDEISNAVDSLTSMYPDPPFDHANYALWLNALLGDSGTLAFESLENMCSELTREYLDIHNPRNPDNCRNLGRRLGRVAQKAFQRLSESFRQLIDEYPDPDHFQYFDPVTAQYIVNVFLATVVIGLVIAALGPAIPAALMAVAAGLSAARIASATTALIAIVTRVVEAGTDHTDIEALTEAVKQDAEFQALVSDITAEVTGALQGSDFPVNCDEIEAILENQTETLLFSDFNLLPQRCSDTEIILFTIEPDAKDCELDTSIINLENARISRCQFLDAIPKNEFEE